MKAKAILLGLVTWFNISLVFGGLSFLVCRGLSPDQRQTFITPVTIHTFSFIVAAVASGFAGYVAGRVARSAEVTHAAVVALIIVIVGFVLPILFMRRHPYPVVRKIVEEIFEFAFAVFGGWLANWRHESINSV